MESEHRYIIVSGNVVDGVEFTGPYESAEGALEDAERLDGPWTIAPLDPTVAE